jgi:hypothetical protein
MLQGETIRLQDHALGFLVGFGLGQECSTSGSFKHFPDAFASAGRALQILVRTDLPANFLTLNGCQS